MATTTADRIFNFSAGPAVLPVPVLEQVRDELLALPGAGASVMEISHRSPQFEAILDDARQRLRQLLAIPSNYQVLMLQGGSRLQFSMIPMNLLRGQSQAADYLISGSWGKNAYAEALREGPVRVVWDGKSTNYNRLPQSIDWNPQAGYAYITSNETIQGVQFAETPATGDVPLVCDASSDFLSRPVPIDQYGLYYACAQKNAGPAGVTVVIIRDDLLGRGDDQLPGYMNYRSHAEGNSMWNTPPTFAIYVLGLVAKWLQEEVGGLDQMHRRNQQKAQSLYDIIDASNGFYKGHAQPACRSLMNVTFRLPDESLEEQFLQVCEQHELSGLQGHRSVGGIRASIYNAMPVEGVQRLADVMKQFASQHASS